MGQALTTPRWPSRRSLVAVWVLAALGFGALLGLARAAEGPLDDPDPARQRPGFVDQGSLPQPAPPVAGIPTSGRRAVVFFERADRLGRLCQALAKSPLPPKADLVVAVAGPGGSCPAASVVADPDARVAGAYGLRTPREGGPPVGYAVVDSAAAIRYRTLDPSVADELDEVATILEAVP